MITIYRLDEASSLFVPISSGDFSDPATLSLSPGGSSAAKKFYIRNSDSDRYYTDLVLRPVTSTWQPISGSAVKVKLLSGDSPPEADRWASVGFNGSSLDPGESAVLQSPLDGGAIDTRLPELGSVGSPDVRYYPFWVRVEAIKGAPIGVLSLALSIDYTESLV